MIRQIESTPSLSPFLRREFEDSGIYVAVEPSLSDEEYVGIKVDDYYAANLPHQEPKAVDFIAVVDCTCDAYVLYILEFKNVRSPDGLKISDIQEKFANTVSDFIDSRFANIFHNSRYKYKKIFLYLVSDAYHAKNQNCQTHSEYLKLKEREDSYFQRDSLKVEMTLGSRLYKVCGKRLLIKYDIPPNPVIRKYTN